MKIKRVLPLVCCLLGAALSMAQDKAELLGTWKGLVMLNNGAEDKLTLVFEENEGQLVGHVTDEFGLLANAPMKEMTLDKGEITFRLEINDTTGKITIHLEGTIEDGVMEGEWFDDINGTGDQWHLEKVVEPAPEKQETPTISQ